MKLRLLNIVLLLLIILTAISCEKKVSTSEPEELPTNGFIFVSSNPGNAKIYMNGRNTGSFTPDSLKWLDEGSHSITLKKELFRDTTFTVDVVENVKNYLDIDYTKNPKMYGRIYCQTEPKGAAVFLDDSITNQVTPTTLKGLWPGDYQIKFQHEDVREDSVNVIVESNKVTNINYQMADTSVWVDFRKQNANFPSNHLTSIEIDNNGVIWIGTLDVGLIRFYNGTWTNYTMENSPLPSNMINDLVIDWFGNVWIATNVGLASFKGSFWNIYDTRNSPLPSNQIYSLVSAKSDLWIGTFLGLVRFNGRDWNVYDTENSPIPHNWITALGIDKRGYVWMGTANKGIARLYKGSLDVWKTYNTETEPILPGNSISAIGVAPNGERWFGHVRTISEQGGLSKLHRHTRFGWESYFQGLLFETVFEKIHFEENVKWVCTSNGLIIFDNPNYSTTLTENNSPLPHNHLKDMVIDRYNTIWFASLGGGLIKYKR